jgi:hypothetical protein
MERRQRAPGERSRRRILGQTARLATIEGLNGCPSGGWPRRPGCPRAACTCCSGPRRSCSWPTVDAARASFVEEVVSPALHSGRPGRERLAALCERFLGYVERRVFPGGCFFVATAAELGARPGIPASCPPGPTRRSWPSSCRPFWPAGLSPRGWVPELSGVASVANWT